MNIDSGDDLAVLDGAIREVTLKLKVQDQGIDRLLGQAFQSHNGARRTTAKFLDRNDTASLVEILSKDDGRRLRHFGATRADLWRFWNRAAVQQALAELIPALDNRGALESHRRDLIATHQRELAVQMDRRPVVQREGDRARYIERGIMRRR